MNTSIFHKKIFIIIKTPLWNNSPFENMNDLPRTRSKSLELWKKIVLATNLQQFQQVGSMYRGICIYVTFEVLLSFQHPLIHWSHIFYENYIFYVTSEICTNIVHVLVFWFLSAVAYLFHIYIRHEKNFNGAQELKYFFFLQANTNIQDKMYKTSIIHMSNCLEKMNMAIYHKIYFAC